MLLSLSPRERYITIYIIYKIFYINKYILYICRIEYRVFFGSVVFSDLVCCTHTHTHAQRTQEIEVSTQP